MLNQFWSYNSKALTWVISHYKLFGPVSFATLLLSWKALTGEWFVKELKRIKQVRWFFCTQLESRTCLERARWPKRVTTCKWVLIVMHFQDATRLTKDRVHFRLYTHTNPFSHGSTWPPFSENFEDAFPKYSVSACRIACEAKFINESCGCKMVHMPGKY